MYSFFHWIFSLLNIEGIVLMQFRKSWCSWGLSRTSIPIIQDMTRFLLLFFITVITSELRVELWVLVGSSKDSVLPFTIAGWCLLPFWFLEALNVLKRFKSVQYFTPSFIYYIIIWELYYYNLLYSNGSELSTLDGNRVFVVHWCPIVAIEHCLADLRFGPVFLVAGVASLSNRLWQWLEIVITCTQSQLFNKFIFLAVRGKGEDFFFTYSWIEHISEVIEIPN